MGGNNEFFENFERNKYLKKLPSMQRFKKGLPYYTQDLLEREKLFHLLMFLGFCGGFYGPTALFSK